MLPWLTAWARLIVDDESAANVANEAIARAASRRKHLRGNALKVAARHEATRLLARGIAASPSEHEPHRPATFGSATSAEPAASAYAPRAADPADDDTSPRDPNVRDKREQTATGRLEMALETLAPYERLACVSYFLDGVSTDAIASLLGVPKERAIRILEGAAPSIAQAVGDNVLPDFSAATDEIEVVTL